MSGTTGLQPLRIAADYESASLDIYQTASEHFFLKVDVFEAGKMGKRKDLSEFDKAQIVMSRRLGQSISKTAALVGCSWSAMLNAVMILKAHLALFFQRVRRCSSLLRLTTVEVLAGSGVMARRGSSHSKVTITVDEYSSNPTQAFTHYNINQSRFQPPHVHITRFPSSMSPRKVNDAEATRECASQGSHHVPVLINQERGQRVEPIPYDAPKPAGHTRFVCVSDTHSRTDGIQMPYGDVLLHTGDFTELGLPSEVKKCNDWLGSLPYEYKVVIAGNHELTFDKDFMADLVKQDYYRFPSVSKLRPEDFDNVQSLLTNCIYLQDSEVTIKGFRIYGTPWTPWFNGWGFNLPRGQSLLDKWNQIPEDIDILMTHGPPLGFRDWVPKELQRVGCVELLNTVQRRVRPKLHVYGGIHEGYGLMTDGYTTFINSSTCTVSFQPTNPPIVFDLPNPGSS
ncbi:metallophosphoesterase domain containing 2b [Silurus meridionalis]|nr:metallophosphoesterase domain containing 2b [Silurus meridionalis]